MTLMSHHDSRLRSECFKRSLRQVQVFSESPPTRRVFWLCVMQMFSRLKFTHCTYFQFVIFLLELKCSCLALSVISKISLDLEKTTRVSYKNTQICLAGETGIFVTQMIKYVFVS